MFTKVCPECGKSRQVKVNSSSELCRSCARKRLISEGLINYTKKLCKFCGKEFLPSSNKQIYCKGPHIRTCPVCKKDYVEDNVENLKRPPCACSYECRTKLTQSTSLQRYGTKAPGNSPPARSKAKKTMQARFGVDYAMQSEVLRKKATQSIIQRYGVDNVAKYPDIMSKRMASLVDTYRRNGGSAISSVNRSFKSRLDEMCIQSELEHQIGRKSYDLYLPDSKTLIEINPTYTHNVIGNHWGVCVDKYYHRDKTKVAEDSGHRCIHVWDWDNWDSIINLVKPATRRVYARKCTVYRLNKDVGDAFLQENHIQGTCRGQLLYLGLVYDGELLQVMTFGKSRFDKNYYVELMRMCSKVGVSVVGGASRLFSYATSEYGLYSIISYCDRSKFTGDVYEKIGMKLARVTPPQEIWSKSTQKITANLLRQRGYDQIFKTNYGKGVSNEELMIENGWLPVFDCGQRVYTFD